MRRNVSVQVLAGPQNHQNKTKKLEIDMKRMTKEQEKFFDLAYSDSVSWGDEDEFGMCNGLFARLGENLEHLSTGVREEDCEIAVYWCDSVYDADVICALPINAKGKKELKNIVTHLMSNDIESLKLS